MTDLFSKLQDNWDWWLILGFAAQIVFSARFIIQWLASERRRESVMPVAFWYLSLGGSLGLLLYALHRGDPVFILAYAFNGFIYVRNLMLIRRKKTSDGVTSR